MISPVHSNPLGILKEQEWEAAKSGSRTLMGQVTAVMRFKIRAEIRRRKNAGRWSFKGLISRPYIYTGVFKSHCFAVR